MRTGRTESRSSRGIAGKDTHRNRAGRAVRVILLAIDDNFVIERLRGDVRVATTNGAAQINKVRKGQVTGGEHTHL